ncbi:MAG: D-aminoacyl-tRNA deacylase [Opitutaceae bacterium]
MRVVIQRVKRAKVSVADKIVGAFESPCGGLLIFLGIGHGDTHEDIAWLVARIVKLRVFEDDSGKMNRSLIDVGGDAMVISQFTLFGNLKKGNRPSFNRAARPEVAIPLYEGFCDAFSEALGTEVERGLFGEDMQIEAANDGPITLIVDSKDRDL